MLILTKREALEMALRPNKSHWSDKILDKLIDEYAKQPDDDLLLSLRKMTKLNFEVFTTGKFTIKY